MTSNIVVFAIALVGQIAAPTPPDTPNVVRKLTFGGQDRFYHYHLPKSYDPKTPTPVVVVLHGAGTNGKIMELFCGMSKQADKSGFIACYPNGTGVDPLLTWN